MKIIDTTLSHNRMVFQKIISKTEMGQLSHFRFSSISDNVMLRVKRNDKEVCCVKNGSYYTSFLDASENVEKVDSAGEWELTIFLLKAEKETQVTVEFYNESLVNKTFYGDLHSHSICSTDAVNTFAEIEEAVLKVGNDFHAVTDHNSYAMNYQYSNKQSDIEFIYGVEMTNSYGHYNFLGIEKPVDECAVSSEEEFIEKILEHRKNGGYVTFNHPFSPKSRICKLPIVKEYCDFVEIWNGPFAIHNKIALKWWHKNLINKIYFPICGGSDTHNLKDDRYYGNPTNCIIAPFKERKMLLSQLKKGHNYLLAHPKIIDIKFYDLIFGDTTDKEFIKIRFESEKEYDLHVVSDIDRIVYNIKEAPEEFCIKDKMFIRFEAYEGDECVFVSNPIFTELF